MTTASDGMTASHIDILHEVSEFSKCNGERFVALLSVLRDTASTQQGQLRELEGKAAQAQQAQNEAKAGREMLGRREEELTRIQADYLRTQQQYREALDALQLAHGNLQRVQQERDDQARQFSDTKVRLAMEQESGRRFEADNAQLKDEIDRLRGVVADQQGDLGKLSIEKTELGVAVDKLQSANDNTRRKVRRGVAIAASLVGLAVLGAGITTWISWAQALPR